MSKPATAPGVGVQLQAGSRDVTEVTTTTGAFSVGQSISGSGIPTGTTITGVPGGGVLEISQPATTSGSKAPSSQAPFGELLGIAVSDTGNVWVADKSGNLDEFSDTGASIRTFSKSAGIPQPGGLAVDSEENLYTVRKFGSTLFAIKYEAVTGVQQAGIVFKGTVPSALAVVPSTNDILVDTENGLLLYAPISQEFSQSRSNRSRQRSGAVAWCGGRMVKRRPCMRASRPRTM